MKEEGVIHKSLRQKFHFLPQDLGMIFQTLVIILPIFRFSNTKTNFLKSLSKN